MSKLISLGRVRLLARRHDTIEHLKRAAAHLDKAFAECPKEDWMLAKEIGRLQRNINAKIDGMFCRIREEEKK